MRESVTRLPRLDVKSFDFVQQSEYLCMKPEQIKIVRRMVKKFIADYKTMMENAEEILHTLEEFSKTSPKYIPHELDDYLGYVAKTGDPVFKWSIIKCLYREKLTSVIADFHEESLSIEVPPCPNVDPFNYERMKANLLDKLESFNGAPFTVQRLSELLTNPRKEYNRADKFMRAVEKNILVVSTIEPGRGAENDLVDEQFNGVPESETAGAEMAPHDRLPETESPNVPYETVQEREPVDDDRQVFAGDEPPDGMPKAAEREAVADVKPAFEEVIADFQ
ncbi:unnamed protein product [Nesidiocoris tenuis]|uniref:Uncharacterized protein n=1 Tax=Nesidiocoris tenuis TaxID=355587 RepID=A0A6H5FXB6_9HEMI|nr:unnamed protein product [Nesidiocoris tenuis]